MVPQAKIEAAVSAILQATPPGTRVIVFGSHARDQAGRHSDLDLLVIEPRVDDRYGEMARLHRIIAPLGIPADLIVATQQLFDYWRETPNTVYFHAATEGRTYESAP